MDELSALRALQAVRDHGTVTAAAGVLRVSPSAVSQQIKRLERLTRRTLFVPSGRRVALTPEAYTLLDAAGPAVDSLEAVLRGHPRPNADVGGHVRVGAFTTAIRQGVLTGVADLRRRYPGLTCSVVEMDPTEALDALVAGTVDVAVTHHWDGHYRVLSPSLTVESLGDDVADVLCHRDAPLGEKPSFADFATYNWVSTGVGTLCHTWLTGLFATHNIRPRLSMEISDFALHVDFSAAGLGLALVPRLGRPVLPESVRVIELDNPPIRHLSVNTRSRQMRDIAINAVTDSLKVRMLPGG